MPGAPRPRRGGARGGFGVCGGGVRTSLRTELTARLGLEWNEVDKGTADVRGVPRDVIEHFSQRRAEILERMRARGERSARAAQVATLDTRRAKTYDVSPGRLREQWRARAAEHGLTARALASALRPARTRPADPAQQERVMVRLAGPEGLTRERSTFTRRDVVQAFAEAASPGAGVRDVEQAADAFLVGGTLVRLEELSGEARFTTRELLEIEEGLLEGAHARRAEGVAVVGTPDRSEEVASRPTLSAEQHELVVALTASGDGVEVVLAPAGTGKTFALDARTVATRSLTRSRSVPLAAWSLKRRWTIASPSIANHTGVGTVRPPRRREISRQNACSATASTDHGTRAACDALRASGLRIR